MKDLIYESIKWFYWHPFCAFLQMLPTSFSYRIAEFVSPILIFLWRGKREKLFSGLHSIYGNSKSEEDINTIVDKSLKEYIKNNLDHLLYPILTPQFCKSKITYIGLEHIDEGLNKGKGVVLLHSHLGNPHIIMPAIGSRGYQLNQIASRNVPAPSKGVFARFTNFLKRKNYLKVMKLRESFPVSFVYIDKFLRSPLSLLSKNNIVAMAMDGREGSKGILIPFLNHQALFFTGVMRLILASEAAVLPCFHIRGPLDTHTILILHPMNISKTDNKIKDTQINISNFAKLLELQVYENPHLYADLFLVSDDFLSKEKKAINANAH
jgi:KDO2-lipid IV(A) lauroyltransferase